MRHPYHSFLPRRRSWLWIVLPIGAGAQAVWPTGEVNAVLAGFLAVGITIASALAFGWRWWAPYLPLASAVALVLPLAPDAYAAFGLAFLLIEVRMAARYGGWFRISLLHRPTPATAL